VAAFVTFDTQCAFEKACEFTHTMDFWGNVKADDDNEFDGAPLYFEAAPEPTNIIWEHRHITLSDQRVRTVIVSGITFLLLFGAFLAFFYLK
jgi:hypothetical protein